MAKKAGYQKRIKELSKIESIVQILSVNSKDLAKNVDAAAVIRLFEENPNWTSASKKYPATEDYLFYSTDIDFKYREYVKIATATWMKYIFKTTAVTSYYLPFYLAISSAAAIVIWKVIEMMASK